MTANTHALRVATYNTHRGIGTDGKQRPERIIDVIKAIDADVIALQEVETDHNAELDALTQFSAQSDYQLLAGPTLFEPNSRYGNAVLTRIGVTSFQSIDISYRRREPRAAMIIDTHWHDQQLRLIASHFGLLRAERRSQWRALLPHTRYRDDGFCILLGDFNEWLNRHTVLQRLHPGFSPGRSPATFPSRWPLFPLDRIFVTPPGELRNLEAWRDPTCRVASDHLPLVATINTRA